MDEFQSVVAKLKEILTYRREDLEHNEATIKHNLANVQKLEGQNNYLRMDIDQYAAAIRRLEGGDE